MFPMITSLLPGLVQNIAPNLINGVFKSGGTKTSTNSAQLKALATQLLSRNTQSKTPIPRPLPPRGSSSAVLSRQVSETLPKEKEDDKTMLYVGLGAVAVVGLILVTRK